MSKLTWGALSDRVFQTGVDRGVLYLDDETSTGVPWNGIASVNEKPSNADVAAYYIDGTKYLSSITIAEYSASLEAYTFPFEFYAFDGTLFEDGLGFDEQPRKPFGFSYRTKVGDGLKGPEAGYQIHLVYNALAQPTQKSYSTQTKETTPLTFSWDITTTPLPVAGKSPLSHFIIDSRSTNRWLLIALEEILYGTDTTTARMPAPDEVMSLYSSLWARPDGLLVIDNGDGTASITGPAGVVDMTGPNTYRITSDGIEYIDTKKFTATS